MAQMCVTTWTNVSDDFFFKKGISRIVLDDIVGIALQLMYQKLDYAPLSETYVVNGFVAWTRESLILESTWMDGCSGCPNEMIYTWVNSQQMCSSKPRWLMFF